MTPRALDLYSPRVQDKVIELLVALGPHNPLGNTAEIVAKFPPQERIFMLIEKLARRMIEFDRLHCEAEKSGELHFMVRDLEEENEEDGENEQP